MPAQSSARHRWFWIVSAVLLAFHMAVAWNLRAPGITTGNDDAVYVQLGRAVQDFTYHETYYVGEPGHVKYPPGYPALLAALATLGGENIDLFLGAGILLSALALGLTADLARRKFSPELGALVLLAVVANPRLLNYPGMVMSESLFLFLLSLSIWAQARATENGRWLVLAGAAAIASALTRSVGVTVIAALCLTLLVQRQYRAMLLTGAASAVAVGAWFLWTALAPAAAVGGGGEAYVADTFLRLGGGRDSFVVTLLVRAANNAIQYVSRLLPAQLPLPYFAGTVVDNAAAIGIIVVLSATGSIVMLRRFGYGLAVVACYLMLIFVWPWPVSRFISVLLPLVILTMIVGAAKLGERFTPRWKLAWPAAVALVVAGTSLSGVPSELSDVAECDRAAPLTSPGCFHQYERDYLAMARWVADSTPSDAVFVVVKEGTFGYFGERQTVPWIRVMSADSVSVLNFVRNLGATHLALSEVREREDELAGRFMTHCESLELVKRFAPTSMVLRFRTTSEPPSRSGCDALASYRESVRTESVRPLSSL